jgi:hypothetical protein
MTESIQEAILKTVAYADLFDYPLTLHEIKRYLIESPEDRSVKEALNRMTADLRLIYTDGFYYLPRREGIIKIRQGRRAASQPKLQKAKQVAAVLKFIPWIKLIGVTGALAMENSDEGDDIDLMIITSPNRLWLTRGMVATFLRLTGQYRRPGKIKDRICPNLMIGGDALEFHDRDLFTAHEIVQMKPVFERGNTYQRFLEANAWVKEFLPNAIKASSKFKIQSLKFSSKFKVVNVFFDFLENLAYEIQLKYMEKKKTTEITTPSVIRFHPQDVRQKVLDEYQKRVYDITK